MDVLGSDLAKLSFDATLLLQTGSSHYAAFPNTPEGFEQLATWLRAHNVSRLHACMEATFIYWQALASWLHAQGYSVSVVNPARIKGYAIATMQRNKTDKLARAISASCCAKHQPSRWQPASQEQQRLRALTRHRDDLLQTQLQQRKRLRDTTDELVRSSLESLLTAIASQLSTVQEQITQQLREQERFQTNLALLTSSVGIGAVTAAKLLSEFADLDQYASAKAAAADAGLTRSHYESGTSVRRRSKRSKIGKAGKRAALYWPAITAMRCCPAIKAFGQRLAARGKPKMVIIGAVLRKLVHICYGVLKHQTPYDPAKAFGHTTPAT